MAKVKTHYDEFLGSVYSWLLGSIDAASEKNAALFERMDLPPANGAIAIDLGAGSGCQSLPLAELGYRVIAVDFCRTLLEEIALHDKKKSVTTICADIVQYSRQIDCQPQLVICMGDTLVHLPDEDSVRELIQNVAMQLAPGGTFIYSIRDYGGAAPEGAERFVPVRADHDRIFTCFLDYQPDVVHVHDILYERINGSWKMTISDYLKLRLRVPALNDLLQKNGLEVIGSRVHDGMFVVSARKAD